MKSMRPVDPRLMKLPRGTSITTFRSTFDPESNASASTDWLRFAFSTSRAYASLTGSRCEIGARHGRRYRGAGCPLVAYFAFTHEIDPVVAHGRERRAVRRTNIKNPAVEA